MQRGRGRRATSVKSKFDGDYELWISPTAGANLALAHALRYGAALDARVERTPDRKTGWRLHFLVLFFADTRRRAPTQRIDVQRVVRGGLQQTIRLCVQTR